MLLTRSPLSTSKIHPKTSFKRTPFDLHVLGAPPAFVLSQDQTLYKWYLNSFSAVQIIYKSFDLFSLSTQSLASCYELLFGNFLKCSQNHLKGSVQASILFNFQGPVLASREAACLLYQASSCLSSTFLIYFFKPFVQVAVVRDSFVIIHPFHSKVNTIFQVFLKKYAFRSSAQFLPPKAVYFDSCAIGKKPPPLELSPLRIGRCDVICGDPCSIFSASSFVPRKLYTAAAKVAPRAAAPCTIRCPLPQNRRPGGRSVSSSISCPGTKKKSLVFRRGSLLVAAPVRLELTTS